MVAVRKPCPKCGRPTNSGAMKAHVRACGRVLTVDDLVAAGNLDTSGTETECWLWRRGKYDPDVYGYYLGKGAHRLMYEVVHGSIPAGMNVCHSCDVKRCVNPKHLWAGTQAENVRDAFSKGRAASPLWKQEWRDKQKASMPCGDQHWTRRHPEKTAKQIEAMRLANSNRLAATAVNISSSR